MQISGYFVNFDLIKKLLIIKCEAQKTSPLIKKPNSPLNVHHNFQCACMLSFSVNGCRSL